MESRGVVAGACRAVGRREDWLPVMMRLKGYRRRTSAPVCNRSVGHAGPHEYCDPRTWLAQARWSRDADWRKGVVPESKR